MSGRALLLSGLLGFSLCVEGRLILQRLRLDPDDPEKTSVRLRGDILVAGTVTLAWAVKKRKSFHTTYDVDVDWQTLLVAAKAGILPVPDPRVIRPLVDPAPQQQGDSDGRQQRPLNILVFPSAGGLGPRRPRLLSPSSSCPRATRGRHSLVADRVRRLSPLLRRRGRAHS